MSRQHFSPFSTFPLSGRLAPLDTLHLSRRAGLLKPTAVNSILAEIRQVQARGRTVISLMRGEPDFDTPVHIVDAAAAAMRAGRTRYPDNRGEQPLREAIAAKLARDNGLSYNPDAEILVTTGATLGIHAALAALVDEGDEVLLPDPIYDAYQSPILSCGGRIRRRGRGIPQERDRDPGKGPLQGRRREQGVRAGTGDEDVLDGRRIHAGKAVQVHCQDGRRIASRAPLTETPAFAFAAMPARWRSYSPSS